jgi:hypothetical protein
MMPLLDEQQPNGNKRRLDVINLNGLKNKELLTHWNEHSEKKLASYKGKTTDLQARLLKLRPDLFFMGDAVNEIPPASDRMDGFEAPASELKDQAGRAVNHEEPPAAVTKKSRKAAKKVAKGEIERGAIRQYCEELLLRSRGVDEATKRPLGLSYEAILEKVQAKFPSAGTSVGCLRWYATKMNKLTGKERVVMPVRPAKKVAKAA